MYLIKKFALNCWKVKRKKIQSGSIEVLINLLKSQIVFPLLWHGWGGEAPARGAVRGPALLHREHLLHPLHPAPVQPCQIKSP